MTFDFIPTADGLRIHNQIENVWTDVDVGGRVEPEQRLLRCSQRRSTRQFDSPTGLQCADGILDLATLPPGRYPAFFLNGCQSYYQGWELAKNGSVGGLVSLEPIANDAAIPAGTLIANLLAYGCTFSQTLAGLVQRPALEYTAISDGDPRLVASDDYTPPLFHLDKPRVDDDVISSTTENLGEVGTELGALITQNIRRGLEIYDTGRIFGNVSA